MLTPKPYLVIDATAAGDRMTGLERYTRELIFALERRHAELPGELVILQSHNAPWAPQNPATHVLRCPMKGRVFAEQAWVPAMICRLRPSVVFFPAFSPSPAALLASRQSFLMGTVHDTTLWSKADTISWKARVYFRPQATLAVHQYDAIHTISRASKHDLSVEFPGVSARIIVSGNGVDLQRFASVSQREFERVREKFSLPSRFLLAVGTIEPRKNLPFLLSVLASIGMEVQEVPLVIAGRFGWGAKEVERARTDLGLEEQVRLLGAVDDGDLPALYAGARALVMPSTYEGFGLPLVEAMAAGTPVVASDIPAMREVIGSAGLLVPSSAAPAWREAITRVWTDDPYRDELVKRGCARSRQFSWDSVADRVLASLVNVSPND